MFRTLIYLRFGNIFLDFLLINLAFSLAYFVRVGWIFSTDFEYMPYALTSLGASIFWLFFLLFARYYKIPPRYGKKQIYNIILSGLGGILSVATLILIYYFQRELLPSRLITLYILIFGTFFLTLSSALFRALLRWQKQRSILTYRTLIIGANPVSEKMIDRIKNNPYALHQIIGVVDPYGVYKSIEGSEILGKLDKLEVLCQTHNINCILQCDAYEQALSIIAFCEDKNVKYEALINLRGIMEENVRLRNIADKTVLSYVDRNFESSTKKHRYRIFDAVLHQVFDID